MERVPRRCALDVGCFIEEFIKGNRPVVISDAMQGWAATTRWNPAYLEDKFGDVDVQIYNNLFTLIDVDTLGAYLARNFGREKGFVAEEYVRGYAKFKDVDFVWADEIFGALSSDWSHPYFFPTSSFVLPCCEPGFHISPVSDPFPYKGLFISGRGARTRLHRDPYGTDAVLCQFFGAKKLVMYRPCDGDKLLRNGQFVDPENVDVVRFPDFRSVVPAFEDVLMPGEALFIPSGWFHDVITMSDSISITWNFVHSANSIAFEREVANPENTTDRDILAYLRNAQA